MTSLIIGEVIIDCVQPEKSKWLFEPVCGGSPYNMALALARLEAKVELCSSISNDSFGSKVVANMMKENIGSELVQRVRQPSTIAMVSSASDGSVSYGFYLAKTSVEAFQWKNVVASNEHKHIHPGSYVALEQSMAQDCIAFISQKADDRLISFDPNIRLSLTPDPEKLRPLVETYAKLSAFIKASDEDMAILYPNVEPVEAGKHMLSLGPELVIITLGSKGCIALHKEHQPIQVKAKPITKIGDSVGAGDSFMAACFWQFQTNEWMSRQKLATLSQDDIHYMLETANQVAGYNCQHFGCNPPYLKDLQTTLSSQH